MLNKDEIHGILKKHKEYLQLQFHITQIGLFGSYTRDEQHKKSDVDILVEFEKGYKDFFNYLRLKSYLEEILGASVDLVMKEAIKPKLKDTILGHVNYV
ncbi:MAG: nucleotidyltransferase [Candidatus Brocadia sp.]|nr:nucleotidyltransferase [Candidatus Brocadia sp.]